MRQKIEAAKPLANMVVSDIRWVTRKQVTTTCRRDPGADNAWHAVSGHPASPLPHQWLRRSLQRFAR